MTDRKRYTKRTVGGYWGLGVICFIVGFIYSAISNSDLSFKQFINALLINVSINHNWLIFLVSLALSLGFYKLFFDIRNHMNTMSQPFCIKEGDLYKLKDRESDFYSLRERFLKIRYVKGKTSDEAIVNADIDVSQLDCTSKESLKIWLKLRRRVFIYSCIYSAICIAVFMLILPYGLFAALFFAVYIMMFVIASWFYTILFCSLRIKSFIRLSYYILYPTILTIAVNLYFGLVANSLLNYDKSAIGAALLLCAFLVFTSAIEIISYSKRVTENSEKVLFIKSDNEKMSTRGFVVISLLILVIAIVLFSINSHHSVVVNTSIGSFSSLLFSVAVALFLGIFEGWDSLNGMCLNYDGPVFAKHYRWWNFLQICYPLAFFFVASIVSSEILSIGLISSFALVSIVSLMIWKKGGQESDYCFTKWKKYKLLMGLITVVLILLNKIVFTNLLSFVLMYPPSNINVDDIDVELVVLLLGAISTISVFSGVKRLNSEKFLIAIPLSKPNNYSDYIEFSKNGYIFDFTNYIYLLYLLVFHVLLFDTAFIPISSNKQESFVTVILLLTIVVYMFLSFKTKAQSVDSMRQSDSKSGAEESCES